MTMRETLEIRVAAREWDLDEESYRKLRALVDAGAPHDGDCTKQCHTCIVCEVKQIREAAADYLEVLSTLTDEMVERGATGIREAWGGPGIGKTWAQLNHADRQVWLRQARACLTEAIRAAKGE